MPMPCYLSLDGENQGKIEGSVQIRGHDNEILVQGVEGLHDIPRSPQTGLPTGKRVHHPLTVVKEIDKSSPKLMQALTSGEQLKTVNLEFYRINDKGLEELYYTIKLQNAIIVDIRTWVPNCLDPEQASLGHMEDVAFTFEQITWTWQDGGIEAEDSWKAPKS